MTVLNDLPFTSDVILNYYGISSPSFINQPMNFISLEDGIREGEEKNATLFEPTPKIKRFNSWWKVKFPHCPRNPSQGTNQEVMFGFFSQEKLEECSTQRDDSGF
ncbi:hypothetical protein CEXT_583091 [Caerostris extrusa]|uniref:Uncharacterized protein n=1 Tax=Caerostris extrusa TaxID=172846 RepID=A0AAV4RY03_CAEEX|nr:hypothetical protein CEXT_583091 [Caerostris extrusa]